MSSPGTPARRRRPRAGSLVRLAWLAIAAMLLAPLAPRIGNAGTETEATDAELLDAGEAPQGSVGGPATTHRQRRAMTPAAMARRPAPLRARPLPPPPTRADARRRVGVPRRVVPSDEDPERTR